MSGHLDCVSVGPGDFLFERETAAIPSPARLGTEATARTILAGISYRRFFDDRHSYGATQYDEQMAHQRQQSEKALPRWDSEE